MTVGDGPAVITRYETIRPNLETKRAR